MNSWIECLLPILEEYAGRDFKFQGFLLQARLAQFAKQDVKIGVFGIYNNAPYQYTCPDLRLTDITIRSCVPVLLTRRKSGHVY
jgi:hypothetical protein